MKNIKKIKILFKIVFQVSPSYFILLSFSSIFSTVQMLSNIILPKYLIESLLNQNELKVSLIYGGVIVIANLLFGFVNKTLVRLLEVKTEYVNRKMTEAMAKKITDINYSYLEDPYYLDLKERAVFGITNQGALFAIVQSTTKVITNIVTLISLIAILFTLSYLLVIALVVLTTVTILLNLTIKKKQNVFFQSIIPLNRKFNYYLGLVFDDNIQKDLRVYKMEPLISKSVNKMNMSIHKEFKKFYFLTGIVSGIDRIINALQNGIIYLYISLRVITDKFGKKLSIGDFTMYANTAINFTLTFNSLFNELTNFGLVLSFLEPFLEFMEIKDVKDSFGKEKLKEIEEIEFRNVSFKYPKTDKYILKGISFKINKGERISIVGLNGAGKTTLIKLLCRLYKIDEGKILINGIDIYDYDYESFINNISVVFQDYRLFAYSLLDNITANEEVDLQKVNTIVEEVGLKEKVESLPKGLSSFMNKNYDIEGVRFSGGQEQKVAIARALYKESSLVILDEPTSALDPIAEAEIYENFNNMIENKTAIYISHRMSSSVFCDKILIINNGEVGDYDSHKNLMNKPDSLYYKLFNSQAINYKI